MTRPRVNHESEHASEGALNDHGFDRLTNDGKLPDLYNQVVNALCSTCSSRQLMKEVSR